MERGHQASPVFRAAIVGTGRIGSTYDEEDVTERNLAAYYTRQRRHVGVYTILPVNHADAYLQTPGFQLVAASDRSEDKLRAFGHRTGINALYTDFHQMLLECSPDVVSVCTQSADKAEVVIACAQAGVKAIVVEKAMATTMAEADAMIAVGERHGALLVVNHPYRFSPLIRETKRLIDDGQIGKLGTVSAFGRAGMLHVGTHTFDLLRYWAGDAAEVAAHMPNYAPDRDLPATGMVNFTTGITGFFDHVHEVQRGFEARGTSGYLTTSNHVGDGWLYTAQQLNSDKVVSNPTKEKKVLKRLIATPIEGEPHDRSLTQRLLGELHQTMTSGAPFISTGRDGAAALELGIACHMAHLAGSPIKLPLADRTFRVPNR